MTCNYDDSLSIPVKVADSGLSTSIRSSSGSTRGRQRLIDFSRNKATDLEGRCISRSRSRSRSQSICRGGLTAVSVSPLEDYNDTLKPTDFPLVIEEDTSTYFLKDSSRRSSSRSRSRSNSSSRSKSSRKSENNTTIPTYFCPVDSLLGHDSFACDSDSEDEEEQDLRMVQSERLLGTPSNHSHSLGRMGHQSERLPGTTTRTTTRNMDRDPSLRLLDLEDDDEDEEHSSYPMPNLGYSSSLSSQRSSASSFNLFDRSRGRNSFSSSSPEEGERIVIPTRRRRSIGGGNDRPSNCSSLPSLLDGSSTSIIDSIQQKEQDPSVTGMQKMRSFRSGPGNRRSLLGRAQSLGRQQVKEGILADNNNDFGGPSPQQSNNRASTTASLGASRRFRQHRRRSSLGGSDGAFSYASATNNDAMSSDTPPSPVTRSSSGSARQQRRSSLVGGCATSSSSGEQLLLMASMSTLNRSRSGGSQRRALPTRSKTISSYTTTRGKQSGSTGGEDSLLGTSNHGFLTGSRIKRTLLDGSQNHLAN